MLRRNFVKSGGVVIGSALTFPNILACKNLNSRLNIALIGVGGRGIQNWQPIINSENINITDEAKKFILKISNFSVKTLVNYLEKFKIYNKNINLSDTLNLCTNISYNNLIDLDSGLKCLLEFSNILNMSEYFSEVRFFSFPKLVLIYKILFWNSFELGIAPIVIGVFFLSSIQICILGIIGKYITFLLQYQKNTPLVIEKERINF